jgi:hypothetical protein
MSSFQYAGQDEVAYNPATEDLNMNLNLITNVAGLQSFSLDADEVNIAANLRFADASYSLTISALGLNEEQTYNLPAVAGTSGQVLGLTGNAGQMIWFNVDPSGGVVSGVTSLNGLTDEVTVVPDASMLVDVSGQEIQLRVAVPVPVGTTDGDFPSWDTATSAYVATAFPTVVTSLNALSDAVNLVPDASMVTDVSGQEIHLRVAVPMAAGTVDGDYPTWDTVLGNYGVGTAPVTSLNGLNGVLGIQAGEAINVDTSGAYITISTALPSGLAAPTLPGDATALSFAITGVSPNVTATSVVHATVQYPDNIASPQDAWLVYATPSDVSGGSITFFLSSAIQAESTLKIAWMVDKF